MSSLDPGIAALLAALVVVALFALAAWARRRRASRRAVVRARRALAGETAAEALLVDAGYTLLDTQVRLAWTFHCDGAPVTVDLRCDAVVSRDGRRLVAEVKTGDRAPSLTTAATRRQLLEYAVAYGADGVLLVDPEAGEVREVDFALLRPLPSPTTTITSPPRGTLGLFAAGVVVGGAATLIAALAL